MHTLSLHDVNKAHSLDQANLFHHSDASSSEMLGPSGYQEKEDVMKEQTCYHKCKLRVRILTLLQLGDPTNHKSWSAPAAVTGNNTKERWY